MQLLYYVVPLSKACLSGRALLPALKPSLLRHLLLLLLLLPRLCQAVAAPTCRRPCAISASVTTFNKQIAVAMPAVLHSWLLLPLLAGCAANNM